MHVLTGHLTPTNKKAISAILNAGLRSGKVGMINYHITETDGIYTVKVSKNDRGMIPCGGSPLRLSTHTSTFKL